MPFYKKYQKGMKGGDDINENSGQKNPRKRSGTLEITENHA
jgi:hypothetical protein